MLRIYGYQYSDSILQDIHARKNFSNENPFLSPHEVRPAPYGQIGVIMTDSTP